MTEMTGSRLRGSLTALVTPFRDGAFDEAAFRKFVRWQIEQGSHGLVPTGTTGESPTLTHAEHDRVVEACIDEAGGRVPVIAGAGSNSTAEAVERAQHAEKRGRRRRAGGDAVLQQADAGGPLRPLQGRQRRGRHSDHHLQHPAALRRRHERRDDGAAVRTEEHRRREGRDRQDRPRQPAASGHGRELHPAFGRRCDGARLQRPGRPRLHLGGGERRAAPLRRPAGGDAGGRLRQGADRSRTGCSRCRPGCSPRPTRRR